MILKDKDNDKESDKTIEREIAGPTRIRYGPQRVRTVTDTFKY